MAYSNGTSLSSSRPKNPASRRARRPPYGIDIFRTGIRPAGTHYAIDFEASGRLDTQSSGNVSVAYADDLVASTSTSSPGSLTTPSSLTLSMLPTTWDDVAESPTDHHGHAEVLELVVVDSHLPPVG